MWDGAFLPSKYYFSRGRFLYFYRNHSPQVLLSYFLWYVAHVLILQRAQVLVLCLLVSDFHVTSSGGEQQENSKLIRFLGD